MPAVFRHPSAVSCFFCQSPVTPLPRNPRSFRCPHCDCWNRYDEHGEITSEEPAMHDENLNARSFAKRGTCPCIIPVRGQPVTLLQLHRAKTVSYPRTGTLYSVIRVRRTKCSSQTCCPTISLRLTYVTPALLRSTQLNSCFVGPGV